MSYTRIRRKRPTRKHYSVIAKLENDMKINDQFQIIINSLTLEEVIAVKLELAGKASGGNIYGIPVWFSLVDIVRDATLKFSLSATRTKMEAARFLGISIHNLNVYMRRFGVKNYFDEEIRKAEVENKFDRDRR